EVVLDGGAVLHAHRQREEALLLVPAYVGDGRGDGILVGPPGGETFHHVDERVGEGPGAAGLLVARRDVDRHEGRVQAAGSGADVVEVSTFGTAGDVFVLFGEPVRDVDVSVYDEVLV